MRQEGEVWSDIRNRVTVTVNSLGDSANVTIRKAFPYHSAQAQDLRKKPYFTDGWYNCPHSTCNNSDFIYGHFKGYSSYETQKNACSDDLTSGCEECAQPMGAAYQDMKIGSGPQSVCTYSCSGCSSNPCEEYKAQPTQRPCGNIATMDCDGETFGTSDCDMVIRFQFRPDDNAAGDIYVMPSEYCPVTCGVGKSCPEDKTLPPTTKEPTTKEPTTKEPTTGTPTTAEPTTAEPTTAKPTGLPSQKPTKPPTTKEPTTAEPTTAEPTYEPCTGNHPPSRSARAGAGGAIEPNGDPRLLPYNPNILQTSVWKDCTAHHSLAFWEVIVTSSTPAGSDAASGGENQTASTRYFVTVNVPDAANPSKLVPTRMPALPNGAFNYMRSGLGQPVAGYVCPADSDQDQSTATFHTLVTPCAAAPPSKPGTIEYYVGNQTQTFNNQDLATEFCANYVHSRMVDPQPAASGADADASGDGSAVGAAQYTKEVNLLILTMTWNKNDTDAASIEAGMQQFHDLVNNSLKAKFANTYKRMSWGNMTLSTTVAPVIPFNKTKSVMCQEANQTYCLNKDHWGHTSVDLTTQQLGMAQTQGDHGKDVWYFKNPNPDYVWQKQRFDNVMINVPFVGSGSIDLLAWVGWNVFMTAGLGGNNVSPDYIMWALMRNLGRNLGMMTAQSQSIPYQSKDGALFDWMGNYPYMPHKTYDLPIKHWLGWVKDDSLFEINSTNIDYKMGKPTTLRLTPFDRAEMPPGIASSKSAVGVWIHVQDPEPSNDKQFVKYSDYYNWRYYVQFKSGQDSSTGQTPGQNTTAKTAMGVYIVGFSPPHGTANSVDAVAWTATMADSKLEKGRTWTDIDRHVVVKVKDYKCDDNDCFADIELKRAQGMGSLEAKQDYDCSDAAYFTDGWFHSRLI